MLVFCVAQSSFSEDGPNSEGLRWVGLLGRLKQGVSGAEKQAYNMGKFGNITLLIRPVGSKVEEAGARGSTP